MIPLYILGLLQRFGPQHGYQIKKLIAELLSDFTQIKLPTIYYHLDKMEAEGYLLATMEKPGSRPEKTVYTITDRGIEEFKNLLEQLLLFEYKPVFASDGVFYFSDYLKTEKLEDSLNCYRDKLTAYLQHLEKHREEMLQLIPHEMKASALTIFRHHELHYKAELEWAQETLDLFVKSKM